MTQIQLLEQHISELHGASFSKLRDWFIEFDQARWDKKLEADSNAGKLDFLINAAIAEHEAGLTQSPISPNKDVPGSHRPQTKRASFR